MGNGTFGMIFALLTPQDKPTYIALAFWASGPPGSRAAANRSGTNPYLLEIQHVVPTFQVATNSSVLPGRVNQIIYEKQSRQ